MLAFFSLSFNINAQNPAWIWAKRAGGTNFDYGYSVCNDASGNVFVTGTFSSQNITFGSYTLTKTGAGYSTDIFLVKYDSQGNVLWAKSAGGTSDDSGESVCVDTNGNVFVTGYFKSSTITFGSYILSNAGNADVLL
jgi:hypothetical protein